MRQRNVSSYNLSKVDLAKNNVLKHNIPKNNALRHKTSSITDILLTNNNTKK